MKAKLIYVITSLLMVLGADQRANAQSITPGFDPQEYADLLELNFNAFRDTVPAGNEYQLGKGVYKKIMRTPEAGLYNQAEIFIQNGNTVVVSLRGTIAKPQSWLENFYFAMVSATGRLRLNDSTIFEYRLAADSQAYVHAGWLLGMASLAPYINAALKPLLDQGMTNIIVMGHSQGGALVFLTTSYLYYKYAAGYPKLRLKTYASAAPKPGNLFYAYDFDHITGNGYAYRIVNTSDWVPESPFSIQTKNDFNAVNPITDAKLLLKKQKFLTRIALVSVYNKLDKSSYKAMKRFRKYMGHTMYSQVHKTLPQFIEPNYVYSMNYITAGAPIILTGDEAYRRQFAFDGKNVFIHHMLKPYLYLLGQQFSIKTTNP